MKLIILDKIKWQNRSYPTNVNFITDDATPDDILRVMKRTEAEYDDIIVEVYPYVEDW